MNETANDPFEKFKSIQREAWSSFVPVEIMTTPPAAKLVRFAEVKAGERVLDIACGTGVVAITAALRGAKVAGLDLTPALIEKVIPTHLPSPPAVATRNIAPAARIVASNSPVPVQYWIRALNDGKVHENPLPPDTWGTWSPNNPAQQWVVYQWEQKLKFNGSRIRFWNDQPAGSGEGVAAPKAWHIEYWNEQKWLPVTNASTYGASTEAFNEVSFDQVETRCLRAVFDASTDGKTYAAVAAQEWEALYPKPVLVEAADTKLPASPVCATTE